MNLGVPYHPHGPGSGWFPLSKTGPTPAHLVTTAVSLRLGDLLHSRVSFLLRSSVKGILSKRGHILQQYTFAQWSNDAISATCSSCLCFFDGNSGKKETRNEGSSSQEMSRNRSFLRGRWTNVLLAINVLLYIAQIATQGKLMLWGAKVNSLIDKGQLWRLVTSSFLHANIGHLMVNCYSLNSVGPTVENICGTRRFLTVYFASAVASTATSYWFCRAPAVGASGAIFGLVGSVAVFSLRHRSLLGGTQDLKHIAQVIALNMVIGIISRGIDNWGHLGGLLGGAAVSWFIGPAWTYETTTRDGRRIFADRAPIFSLTRKKPQQFD